MSARQGVVLGLPLALAAVLGYGGCSAQTEAQPGSDAGSAESALPDAALPDATSPPFSCDTDRAADGVWQHLGCTGLYTDLAQKRVDPRVRAYKPGLELWVDGAAKERFIFLPPGTKIDTTNIDEWVFPSGTKLWKEFRLDGKRIETRLYEKGADAMWRHAAFVWNADETEAVRVEGRKIARGGPEVPPYEIPTPNQCNDCHGGRSDRVIGFDAISLGLPAATGLTLAVLVAEGLLTRPPASTAVAFPEDATGKAAEAIGWLHVSCSPCHNRSSGASARNSSIYLLTHASELLGLDGGAAPVAALDAYTTTVGRATTVPMPDGGGGNFEVIKAGAPSASLASFLSGQRVGPTANPNEKEQMPPIVSRVVDVKGHALLDAWITALP